MSDLALPAWMWDVRYDASRTPDGIPLSALRGGANCQLFAYAVLAANGITVPPVRSSELWLNASGRPAVTAPEQLDLVLFNATPDPYAAHVGVVWDDDAVLHLCAEVGRPSIWSYAEFRARSRYATVVGPVRPRTTAAR